MRPFLRVTTVGVVLAVIALVSIGRSNRPELRVTAPPAPSTVARAFATDPTPPSTTTTTEPPPVTTLAPDIKSESAPVDVAPRPSSVVVETPPPPNNNVITAPSGCAYEQLIRSVFVEDPDWAVAIAWRESNCQPGARNPSGSSGLFQLLLPLHNGLFASVGCTPDQWPDPVCNVNAAHVLYLGSGRAPWAL